jgi:hypothetical protein
VIVAGLARALQHEYITAPHIVSDLYRELAVGELNGLYVPPLYAESFAY